MVGSAVQYESPSPANHRGSEGDRASSYPDFDPAASSTMYVEFSDTDSRYEDNVALQFTKLSRTLLVESRQAAVVYTMKSEYRRVKDGRYYTCTK